MESDGFVSLLHPGGRSNVIFLRTGLATFQPPEVARRARDGPLLVPVADNLDDGARQRFPADGLDVLLPPQTEPWGERYARYRDPNGLIIQPVHGWRANDLSWTGDPGMNRLWLPGILRTVGLGRKICIHYACGEQTRVSASCACTQNAPPMP